MKNRPFLFLGAWVVVLLALVMPAFAAGENTILRVGPGQEYETIQAAVDDARRGYRILVFPDTYNESVSVTQSNLQILAQGDGVVVRPPDTAGFRVHADYVTIRDFEIAYGAGCAPGIEFQGSRNIFADNYIYLDASCLGVNALVCRDPNGGSDFNVVERNTIDAADLGIVIVAETLDAINRGNIIRDNTLLEVAQTPIAVANGIDFLVSGNSISGAPFGHCIAVGTLGANRIAQGHHEIANNTINHCAGNGISLYAYPGTVLSHNRISGNTIQNCGLDCIALEAGDGAALTRNVVLDNEASFSGICGIALGADPFGAPGASVSKNLVHANTVYRNLSGICLNPGANYNWATENLAQDQSADGIAVFGARNELMGNTAHDNDRAGIEVQGNNNSMFNNTALRNAYFDLADEGTGNRWQLNEYETANW